MLHPRHTASAVALEGGACHRHPDGGFIAVGIEHSTAPIAIRERVALQGGVPEEAHRALSNHPAVAECVALSTCNRTELYMFTGEPAAASDAARTYLGADHAVRPYIREWRDICVAEHLLRVSAGLESQILGEQQILSQVRQALEHAERLSTLGPHLHQLFRSGIACGRTVRQATSLGQVDASIAVETVRAAELAMGPLDQRRVLVVGGGEVSRLAAAELRRRGIGRLYLANRTLSVAGNLAEQYRGVAMPLTEVGRHLASMDGVISATSAPGRILSAEAVQSASHSHLRSPLHLFDLAVPRDIDPAVGRLPGIILHDLDSLMPARIRERCKDDIRVAERIIRDHVQEFESWYRTRRIAPLIGELQRQLDEVAVNELHRASPRLAGLSQGEQDAVQLLANRLTNAIFHRFVTRLRHAACTDDARLVEAAAFFFASDAHRHDGTVLLEPPSLGSVMSTGGGSR